jgi:hypothetical protein
MEKCKMLKRLLRNRKGTAEVIGSVMFIVILLFFFTNVYLWHDAATKEMNQLYVNKINSPIKIAGVDSSDPNRLTLTAENVGGSDAKLSILWITVEPTSTGFDKFHGYYNLTKYYSNDALNIPAGSSITIHWAYANTDPIDGIPYAFQNGDKIKLELVTTVGNLASFPYTYGQ